MLKSLLKFILGTLALLGLIVLVLWLTGHAYLWKGLQATYFQGETTATIDDARFFDQRLVPAGVAQPWPQHPLYNAQSLSDTLRTTLERTQSAAFLVIKGDSILQEHYWGGYGPDSASNSFSMAKSIVAMLTQIAIQKGYIGSWQDRLIDYCPEIQGAYRQELRLFQLAGMAAGLKWDESYQNPFGITARAYYGSDLKKLMQDRVAVVRRPQDAFEYQSGATQWLAMCLMRATGKSLSQLASEWLWQPLGAAQDASWHLDNQDGLEIAYCCFNSNARDFARLGKLLLHYGQWKGQEILDSNFVSLATGPGRVDHYGLGFWNLDAQKYLTPVFYLRGVLGQYVVVFPEKDLVMVRLGKQRLPKAEGSPHPQDLELYVQETLKYYAH